MKTRIHNQNASRGIALMMVMLVIFVLTAIVAGFAYSMKVEMRLARADNYDSDLEWVARGAIEVAKFALTQKSPNQANVDALNQAWAGGIGTTNDPLLALGIDLKNIDFGTNARACVTIVDMERKWNINALANPRSPQPMIIQQALNVMGVTDVSENSTITDSILDWVDPDDMRRFNGAEGEYYLHLDPPYYCKDGFIDDLSELLLIKGVTPEMYSANTVRAAYQMRTSSSPLDRVDEIPVYPYHFDDLFATMGSGRININTASAAVLQLIPGMDPEMADQIIRMRAGDDGIDGTEDDVPFVNPMQALPQGLPQPPPAAAGKGGQPAPAPLSPLMMMDVRSSYFEVKAEVEVNGYKRTYYAIIHRAPGRVDPEILRFYSE